MKWAPNMAWKVWVGEWSCRFSNSPRQGRFTWENFKCFSPTAECYGVFANRVASGATSGGQVPNHGFRGRFGFRRDGSRTVLARFRKKAYDLWPKRCNFLTFQQSWQNAWKKHVFSTSASKVAVWQLRRFGRVTCAWCVDFPSRSRL